MTTQQQVSFWLGMSNYLASHPITFIVAKEQKTMRTLLTAEQRKIKTWMINNVEDNLQPNSPWEVNCTGLAENCAWFSGLVDPNVLDDETHFIWDLAVDVAEWYEERTYEEIAS